MLLRAPSAANLVQQDDEDNDDYHESRDEKLRDPQHRQYVLFSEPVETDALLRAFNNILLD